MIDVLRIDADVCCRCSAGYAVRACVEYGMLYCPARCMMIRLKKDHATQLRNLSA